MGKLIVFEGTDGSGKSTQFRILTERLDQEKIDYTRLVFPQYSEPSSALIRMYLGGEFGGKPSDVNAYAASTFFAVDRYASYKKIWKPIYDRGGLIISDRYTTSNAVHQASKEPPEARAAFLDWLYDLEFNKMELPKPDLVLYLDMPVEMTQQLMHEREEATGTHADIHEQDIEYLQQCKEVAEFAAAHYGWIRIRCAQGNRLRTVRDIHEEIFSYVKRCLEDA